MEASSFKIRPNGYDVIQPFFLFYKISKFKLSTTFHKSFPIFSQVFTACTLAETELFERVRYGRPSLAGASQRKEREKWTRRGITRLCRGRRGPLGSSPTRSQTFQLVIAGCRLLSCRRSLASEPVSLSLSLSLYTPFSRPLPSFIVHPNNAALSLLVTRLPSALSGIALSLARFFAS